MNKDLGTPTVATDHLNDPFIFPDWPAPANIRAVSTTRLVPGTSSPPFDRCNLGDHVSDDPNKVARNRTLLKAQLSLPNEPLWLQQIHGTEVFDASKLYAAHNEAITADASVTRMPAQVLAILTADCLPIFLCNMDGTEVAAIHAGWRGLATGVIEQTLACMKTKPWRTLAWLGPGIGPAAFEVAEDVRQAFLTTDSAAKAAFHPISTSTSKQPKWLCDLYLLARQRLQVHGIQQIFGGGYCTFSDPTRFYSHRRDRISGRMASLIWIEPGY